MNRRGFIGRILAIGSAPAIVKAESLIPPAIVMVDEMTAAKIDTMSIEISMSGYVFPPSLHRE